MWTQREINLIVKMYKLGYSVRVMQPYLPNKSSMACRAKLASLGYRISNDSKRLT
jgi:hypothetical protein